MNTERVGQTDKRVHGPRPFTGAWFRRIGKILLQSIKDMLHDSGPQWAAALVYYALLSLFPMLILVVSVIALVADPNWVVGEATNLFSKVIPQGSDQVNQAIQGITGARAGISAFSFIALLWTGTRVFSTMTSALNIAFGVEKGYSFWRKLLVELGMLGSVGLFFVLALVGRQLIGLLWNRLGLLPRIPFLGVVVAWVVQGLLLALVFFLLYYQVPRKRVNPAAAWSGAAVAVLLFVLVRPLFAIYIQRFANYNLIYGSLAIVVGIMVWAWVVALVLLFGGEVAAHVQAVLVEGRPVDEVEDQHEKRRPTDGRAKQRASP